MMRSNFAKSILLTAVLSGLFLSACTRKKSNEYGLDIRETLRINLQTEPPTLDYNKATDNVSTWVNLNIMEGLVTYDYDSPDLKALPALAESWDSSDKHKVWTFKIRKGVKWTDGVELKAQHFVDSWERLLNPSTASEYSYYLYGIKNAQEYFDKKITDFEKVGVKAIDDYTLVVTLKDSASFFPYLLTHRTTYPLRKDVIEKHGSAAFSDPEKMVVLGPYKVKTWEHDKVLIMERNEEYYGEKPQIKYILGYMINEGATALNLFDAGKLDFLPEFPSVEMARQKVRPEYRSHSTLILQYYGFNTKKKPLDNVNLRKAIVHSINRDEIVEMIAGGQTPTTSFVPKGMFGHNESVGLPFNPEKAKEYLAKAGYSDTKKVPKIVIGINTNDDHKRVAENLQAQIKKNLGLDVEIQNEEWKVYLNKLRMDPPNIFRMGWVADYPDPDNFINLFTSYSANNHTKWKNTEYDRLVDRGVAESDSSKRLEIYNRAQKMMLEDEAIIIPLYNSVRQKLISPRVVNYPINALDYHDYRKTSLKQ